MPIYSNYSGKAATNMRRLHGRRKYFTTPQQRGMFREMPAISWNRTKRQQHRENALALNEQYVSLTAAY